MIYKLASRDNIDGERFEVWPAVLNKSFTKFNNTIEDPIFHSEDDILNWLESKSRTKSSSRSTNSQDFRNGDPNKLYSVYRCDHKNNETLTGSESANINDCSNEDVFLYSLRQKKTSETYMTFINEKGERLKSSFKKIDQRHYVEITDYSSEMREIENTYFEGIYPLDMENSEMKDNQYEKYMKYVNDIHDLDTNENKEKTYDFIIGNSQLITRWISMFLERLTQVENYLEFFSKGGNIYYNINRDKDHEIMIKYILTILQRISKDTDENDKKQIRSLIIDPYLFDNEKEIYQVRYNKKIITWHKNYKYIIKQYNLIPSKEFATMIMKFNLGDFYKQHQSNENLATMIKNLEAIYGIDNGKFTDEPKMIVKRNNSYQTMHYKKLSKSFNKTNNKTK